MHNYPLLDRALYLLEAGFHVIPLGGADETPPDYFIRERHNGDVARAREQWPKTPRVSWKAFQSAPPSESTVQHWWRMWPNANVGIATGKLIVVDADSDEANLWVRKNLTYTPWRVKTGRGYHFYYAENPELEIRNSADPLAKIDTRGLGGYVVAAGSVHSSGSVYTDDIAADAGAVALCDLPMLHPADLTAMAGYRHENMQLASAASPKQGEGNLVGFDARRFDGRATGEPVAEGGRNDAAASLAGQYIRDGMALRDVTRLLTSWNGGNAAPLSDVELHTTIASVALTHTRNHPDLPVQLEAPAIQPMLTRAKKPIAPFPAHLLHPPGLLGDVTAYINNTSLKEQPVLALGASIAFLGTIMGRKVRTRTNLRTNPYVIGVGDSGCGKEHARKAIKRLLKGAGALSMLAAERLASDAGLFGGVYNSPSCLILADEIGRVLKAMSSKYAAAHLVAIQTMLMELSGSADAPYQEKRKAEHIDASTLKTIEQPNVCLYGTTVPGRLFESITQAEITDGFLPRILVFNSDDPDPEWRAGVDPTPPEELLRAVELWVARPINAYAKGNLDMECNPMWVDFAPDAQQAFDAFEAQNRVRRAATRGTGIDAMWARALEHAMRLGLIRACGVNFDQPLVGRDDAAWACELVAFLLDRAISEININVADNEHEAAIKRVLDYVAGKGAVRKGELLRKFQNIKAQDLNGIVTRLQESGDIEVRVEEREAGTLGRPAVLICWSNEVMKEVGGHVVVS